MIAPIAAFAGLVGLTTLLSGHDDQAAAPSPELPHVTRVSETTSMETEVTPDTAETTVVAEQPLALRKPVTGERSAPRGTSVTVPSAVVASSSTTVAKPRTPCTGRTTPPEKPSATTTTERPTTTTSSPKPTTTTPTAASTTTTVASTPKTSTGDTTAPKKSASDTKAPKKSEAPKPSPSDAGVPK
ncbi:hypothetical protein BCF44_12522 [Kutzneria buriramensis]|uniref:Uncharacterized protein n=1 Tax=Kutzneria buriramensis TaxID=1045776 RepID=A0A3E0GUW2_9PSEU|nr:hypothetical protein BCF44_12522 [Kutzneria buriramensis]